jgi:hypothetical protein
MFSLRWFMSLEQVAPVRGQLVVQDTWDQQFTGDDGPPVPTEALTRRLNHWFHCRETNVLVVSPGTRARSVVSQRHKCPELALSGHWQRQRITSLSRESRNFYRPL